MALLPEVYDIEMAAALLGETVPYTRVLAQRDGWRRIKTGRTTLYYADDIHATADKRHADST